MELVKDELKDKRYDGFSKLCSMINEENIHYFRNNGYFKLMVENVSLHFSNEYYRIIKEKYSSLFSKIDWKKLETLSNIGSPQRLQYSFNNNTYSYNPKILCYMLFTLDILTHIKNNTNLQKLNIVEIGGGYGFQAIILYELASLFDLEVEKYTVVDLKDVCNLQNTFVKECNKINNEKYKTFQSLDYDNYTHDTNSNFFVSNYALGEFNKNWQNIYIRNIISKINNGYICWNFSPSNPKIHSYFNSKPVTKEEEYPQTNTPPIKSYIIRY